MEHIAAKAWVGCGAHLVAQVLRLLSLAVAVHRRGQRHRRHWHRRRGHSRHPSCEEVRVRRHCCPPRCCRGVDANAARPCRGASQPAQFGTHGKRAKLMWRTDGEGGGTYTLMSMMNSGTCTWAGKVTGSFRMARPRMHSQIIPNGLSIRSGVWSMYVSYI